MPSGYDGVQCVTEAMVEELEQKKREGIDKILYFERMHGRLQRYQNEEEDL